MAQTDEPVKQEIAAAVESSIVRGDMVQKPSQFPGKKHYTLHNNNTFYWGLLYRFICVCDKWTHLWEEKTEYFIWVTIYAKKKIPSCLTILIWIQVLSEQM